MSAAGEWLTAAAAAALLVGLVQCLMPEGTVKEVGRVTGGLLLFLVLVRPLLGAEYASLGEELRSWQAEAEAQAASTSLTVSELETTLIEERTGAYLVRQAQAAGVACTAEVTCCENADSLIVPVSAEITGAESEAERETIRALASELGLTAEQIVFLEEGETDGTPEG